jgi:hypothetical protein
VVDAPAGSGPKLHRHPYEEVFVVQEGTATFTAGEETLEVKGGQVVIERSQNLSGFASCLPSHVQSVDPLGVAVQDQLDRLSL